MAQEVSFSNGASITGSPTLGTRCMSRSVIRYRSFAVTAL